MYRLHPVCKGLLRVVSTYECTSGISPLVGRRTARLKATLLGGFL